MTEAVRIDGAQSTEAVIDNGTFGTRTIRFETGGWPGRPPGSAVAYLDDDTMVLSATTASKKPKDNLDFFPLTVDVEERMYAAGRIPGSFFRREGRPSEDAILTCPADRPAAAPVVHQGPAQRDPGRRDDHGAAPRPPVRRRGDQRRVAVHAAGGLPFSGPIGGVRVALIEGQWVGFPTHPELERATFDMVVAGRVLADGDVAIMMVEAESTRDTIKLVGEGATAPTEETVAEGLEAAKPFIKVLCKAQSDLAAVAAKETAEYPIFLDYQDDVLAAVTDAVSDDLAQALTIAASRSARPGWTRSRRPPPRSSPSSSRGARRRSPPPTAPSPRSWSASGSSATGCASTAAA